MSSKVQQNYSFKYILIDFSLVWTAKKFRYIRRLQVKSSILRNTNMALS